MSKLLIKISGKDVYRYIKNLSKTKINFYDISYIDKSAYIKVDKLDYDKIRKIKTLYKIEIIRYYGILKIKYFILKYIILLLSLIISFLLFLVLTNIIFDVDIKTNNKSLNKILIDELEENKISKYNLVVSYSKKEKIKKDILNKYKDKIEWLEIKRIGTRYEVLVEERLIDDSKTNNTPRNIVAKKNAIITSIKSTSGEIIGKVNSYVKRGDILISGDIHKKEDVVATVRADGQVLGETWYKITVEIPNYLKNYQLSGNKDTYLSIKLFNKEFRLFDKNFRNREISNVFSIKNTLLPIGIYINKSKELIIDEEIFTHDKAILYASNISKNKLYDMLGKNIQIIYEKDLKLEELNSKIVVVMFYKIIEDITDYSNIEIKE